MYELTAELPGFRRYVRQGITVQVSQTGRIDVVLDLGAVTDSVTVNADVSLLKTNTTEVSHNTDQTLTDRSKVGFYYSYVVSESTRSGGAAGGEGLPDPISAGWEVRSYGHTTRLSYDNALTRTLLFHAAAGYQSVLFASGVARPYPNSTERVEDYDSFAELGLKGAIVKGFPRLNGLSSPFGGAPTLGVSTRSDRIMQKPSAALSITSVRGNHTYKAGAEWRIDAITNRSRRGMGIYNFSPAQTAQPYLQTTNVSGSTLGFAYASFLLGMANSAELHANVDAQFRKTSWALFVQDNWKATRKLTLDYGLRWDLQQPLREIHGRFMTFDPNVPNPTAGGLSGGVNYDGYGPGACQCRLVDTYPYAFGPRLGFAYNFLPKTVLRGGWGPQEPISGVFSPA